MQLYVVFILVVISFAVCSGVGICDICHCQSNNFNVYAVSCDCDQSTARHITTTMENMKDLHHFKTFHVSNCDSLTFERNSFKDAHDMMSVTILHVGRVDLPVGVFAELKTLKIEDVSDLRFGDHAFTGTPLTEVYIRNSRMNELPHGAFFSMKDLHKFELRNITVLRVQSDSMKLSAKHILITESYFESIAKNAMDIDAENSIDITYSTFEYIEDNLALKVKSREINIENNWFPDFPIGLLSIEITSDKRVSFINNTVRDFTLRSDETKLNGVDFRHNLFLANCSSVENVLAYKSNLNNGTDQLLENNFWESQCLSGLLVSLAQTELSFNNSGNMSECDEYAVEEFITEICLGPTPSVGMASRAGKGLEVETTPSDETTSPTEDALMTLSLEHHQDMHPVYSASVSFRKEVGTLGLLFLIAVFVSSW